MIFWAAVPQIYANVNLLSVENDTEKTENKIKFFEVYYY